jgi:hypothetical protein
MAGPQVVDITPGRFLSSPQDTHSLVYDRAAQTAILFGGFNTQRLSGTWSWTAPPDSRVEPRGQAGQHQAGRFSSPDALYPAST